LTAIIDNHNTNISCKGYFCF